MLVRRGRREEGRRGVTEAHPTCPVPPRKQRQLPPSRKKAKGQSKLRRRTVNPKKMKKGDRSRTGTGEDSMSEGEEGGRPRDTPKAGAGGAGGGIAGGKGSDQEESESDKGEGGEGGGGGEEEEWNRLQQSMKKHSKKKFEQNSTESPPVHGPHFPEVSLDIRMYLIATFNVHGPHFPEGSLDVRMYLIATFKRVFISVNCKFWISKMFATIFFFFKFSLEKVFRVLFFSRSTF